MVRLTIVYASTAAMPPRDPPHAYYTINHYIIITSSSGQHSWRSRDGPGPLWLSSSCQGPSPGASQTHQWPEGWPPQRTLRSPYEGSTPWTLCRPWSVCGRGRRGLWVWSTSMAHPSYGITGDLAEEFSVWCAHDQEYPGQLVDVLTTHIITLST